MGHQHDDLDGSGPYMRRMCGLEIHEEMTEVDEE
jgi:hypothetical protein